MANKLGIDRRGGLPKEPGLELAVKKTQRGSQTNFWAEIVPEVRRSAYCSFSFGVRPLSCLS